MTKAKYVPITGSVLDWAIKESGYSRPVVAQRLRVSTDDVGSWVVGAAKPTLTQFRKLAALLKRPSSVLLLPSPPMQPMYAVQFRHPLEPDARAILNPDERRYLREAARIQRTVSWIREELGYEADLPAHAPYSVGVDDPEAAGTATRTALGVTSEDQSDWANEYEGLRTWRLLLESAGILVFSFPMGKESCRGFSMWNANAPAVAINSAWSATARIFTLLHEYGHLATRTDSACIEGSGLTRPGTPTDFTERWCERFAAAALLPADGVKDHLRRQSHGRVVESVDDLRTAAALARKFKVSLRAATVRLIEMGLADWSLYRQIPPIADHKQHGGGGEGRRRPQIRLDEYGNAATSSLFNAVDHELLDRSDVASYLNLSGEELDVLQHSLA